MSIEAIRELVLGTNMTASDLDELIMLVKFKRGQVGKQVMRQLSTGANVTFINRQGRTVQGVIKALKLKNAVVTVNGINWKVPAAMLTVV